MADAVASSPRPVADPVAYRDRVTSQRPGPVLVTGANSGIGLATSLHLAARGWTVLGTVRSRAKSRVLRDSAVEVGVAERVRPIVLDVSDHDAVIERWPRLPEVYAVVNNAGTSVTGAVETVTAHDAKALLDINLITPAVLASCALPAMRRRRAGRIVMVSSIAGREAVLPFHAWYHASKFGLEALSDILRMEVAPFGVKVAVVQPGFFGTSILTKASEQFGSAGGEGVYEPAYRRSAQVLGLIERMAPPPGAVARAIASAIESRRPKRRYLVGRDAQALRGVRYVPDEVTDRVVSVLADLGSAGRSPRGATLQR